MTLGIGVIGLGVGMRLAEGFSRDPRCHIAALCDVDPARLAQGLKQHVGAKGYAVAEALIEDPTVDVVVVASYDDMHHSQVMRAFSVGKHVFSEKPLCLTKQHADEIYECLNHNKNIRLTTNTVLRMSPRFISTKNEIEIGNYGDIYYAEADYDYGRISKLIDGWRGKIPNYSVMLGGGIHIADLVLWLMGGTPAEVSAYGADRVARQAGFAGNDLTVALVRFDDGRLAKLGANFGCVRPHFHRLMLYGTKATFENRAGAAELWTSRDADAEPELVRTAYPGVHKADLGPGFIDAILGIGEPAVNEDDVFRALDLCLAIDLSAREGCPVSVTPRPPLRTRCKPSGFSDRSD